MLNITSSSYSVYETGKVLIQTSFIYEIVKSISKKKDKIFITSASNNVSPYP